MTRTLVKLTLGASLAMLVAPLDVFAGRGGGRGGGGMQRGGGEGGGGGMQRGGGEGGGGGMQRGGGEGGGGGMQRGGGEGGGGGMQRGGGEGGGGGMQRGGQGGGGMQRGGEGAGMSHSPAFSQPQSPSNRSNSGAAAAGAGYANRNQSGPSNAGSAAAGAGYANRSQSGPPNAGSAAAGAGYANRSQSGPSNAGSAAAGAGYANRSQSGPSNAGAAAAGAGAANRNQSQYPNAGAAAAGAGYANRNQSQYPNAGAAAAGAGYANRNQPNYPNAGAAAAGVAYGNRNGYDQYHPGMAAGYWNGNYGSSGLGAYGGMGMASSAYGYGSSPYMNPYVGSGIGSIGVGQAQPSGAPANNAPASNSAPYDYSQPVNTAAAPPDLPSATDPSTTPMGQARQAFHAGDYANAIQLAQQAIGQMPNDVSLHEFLALALFAQGNYEQAAAPLYAVLSVGPGWDWTTLIGNYSDASVYTTQLRGLEAFVRANPKSAKAEFVLAYQYISQGQGEAAIRPLQAVVSLQPNDKLSAQLLNKLQPQSATVSAQPVDASKLTGVWVAQAPPNATITLSIGDDGNFTWALAAPDKPPVTIKGPYTLTSGLLTLSGKSTPGGPLAGEVAFSDDKHLSFKAVGSPSGEPGLQFTR